MLKKTIAALIIAGAAAVSSAAACAAAETESVSVPTKTVSLMQDRMLTKAKITLRYASYTYTGSPITPDKRNGNDEVTVTLGGVKLKKDTDYKVYYKDNRKVGTAQIMVVGCGKYTGMASREFIIKPATAKITTLETGKGNVVVNWDPVRDAEGYQILYSTDRTFANYHSTTVWASEGKNYVNLKNVPEPGEKYYIKMRAFVTKDGKRYGNYSSLRSKTVKGGIGKITVPTLNYVYRGRDLKPTVTVRDTDGNKLKEGTDYTYTIANCKNVGTATITVKGKGKYTGTGTKKFNVVQADIADASVSGLDPSYMYTGSAVKPVPTLKYKSYKLVNGTDFTLSYSNNTSKGTATVTVRGKGNFKGSLSKTFKIIGSGMVTKNGATYFYDAKGVMQTGWQEIGGNYYCFDRISGKLVTNTTINKVKVDKTGKAVSLTPYLIKRIQTMMTAHQKVLELTDPSDSMEEKRLKVFRWEVFEHPYYVWRLLANCYKVSDEWDVEFANDIFQRHRGCCVADSCACAFMFIEIGYKDIWIGHDGRHGWFFVGNKLYDPLFAENVWDANYNSDYVDYRRDPVGLVRMD